MYDHFFLQRPILGKTKINISTCGFFDYQNPQRNLIIATRKVLGDGGFLNIGMIVETIPDPANLLQRTTRILEALQYRGPFEMEFLYAVQDSVYYVLELNMRFWMQHGLFIDGYENRLLKYYLDLDCPQDWYPTGAPFKPMVWLDTVQWLIALGTRRWHTLLAYGQVYLRALHQGAKLCLYPDPRTALAFVCQRSSRHWGKSVRYIFHRVGP
jgi:hypothetical protein